MASPRLAAARPSHGPAVGGGAQLAAAAEGLALGLANRIDEDPDRVAVGLAETLASLGPLAAGKIKAIASAGGLLDRLRTERRANQAAWERMIARGAGVSRGMEPG